MKMLLAAAIAAVIAAPGMAQAATVGPIAQIEGLNVPDINTPLVALSYSASSDLFTAGSLELPPGSGNFPLGQFDDTGVPPTKPVLNSQYVVNVEIEEDGTIANAGGLPGGSGLEISGNITDLGISGLLLSATLEDVGIDGTTLQLLWNVTGGQLASNYLGGFALSLLPLGSAANNLFDNDIPASTIVAVDTQGVAFVPVPPALPLLLSGIGGLFYISRRNRTRKGA
ncbi:MAG: hypothetical protein AAGI34_17735 [Pseudomonadota bacterium]